MPAETIPQSQGVQHHTTSGRGFGAWPAGSPSWAEGPWWATTPARRDLAAQALPQAQHPNTQPGTQGHICKGETGEPRYL